MSWFNYLYYALMVLAFLICLGRAAMDRREPARALGWLVASPFVALLAPVGILAAAIAAVIWVVFTAISRAMPREHRHGRALSTVRLP
ncbi:hypothetical protein ACIQGZ_00055 [Streptomyces sp. NPDC092296]|uniref:hypothetical protein n=1 Tax=Streptomyces sp. NPDC092296 TaxID=3366012 RepID=UPI00381F3568